MEGFKITLLRPWRLSVGFFPSVSAASFYYGRDFNFKWYFPFLPFLHGRDFNFKWYFPFLPFLHGRPFNFKWYFPFLPFFYTVETSILTCIFHFCLFYTVETSILSGIFHFCLFYFLFFILELLDDQTRPFSLTSGYGSLDRKRDWPPSTSILHIKSSCWKPFL